MELKKISDSVLSYFSDTQKRSKLLVFAGVLGMVLILLSEILPSKQEKPVCASTAPVSNEEYVQELEKKLCSLVEQISGAGKAHVMVTLEQGTEYVYASENKKVLDETKSRDGEENSKIQQKDNSESKIVVITEKGTSRPLVETSREPKVKGVVVVCEGGSRSVVKEQITEVLTTVLGIRTNQVCVAPKE